MEAAYSFLNSKRLTCTTDDLRAKPQKTLGYSELATLLWDYSHE